MNQRKHTWIAIRAIALLEDEGQEKNLVRLLKPHAKAASVGAWIPDQVDAKRGGAGSKTENHVLKIKPYSGTEEDRFTMDKQKLLQEIGNHRQIATYIQQDTYLDSNWWSKPYRGDVPKAGQHLPNRCMAMGTMLKDLLLLGEDSIDQLIPGAVRFTEYMESATRTQEEAAATYFFMMSHFLADVSMPCHCDARALSAYSNGLHKELEAHWSKKVGTQFEKKRLIGTPGNPPSPALTPDQVLQAARDRDITFNLSFTGISVPELQPKHDVWLEVIYLCRASFALASIIAPYKTYPYDRRKLTKFSKIFDSNLQLLSDVDQIVMHDAVVNTAIFWKHIWKKVSKL